MTKTILVPLEQHLVFGKVEERNRFHKIVKDKLGLNTEDYRSYLTVDRELIILLIRNQKIDKKKSDDFEREIHKSFNQQFFSIDLLTVDKYDANIFQIDEVGLEYGLLNLETLSFSFDVDIVIPDAGEENKFYLELLSRMDQLENFNKHIISKLDPRDWTNRSTIKVKETLEKVRLIEDTAAKFISDILDLPYASDYGEGLQNLVKYIKELSLGKKKTNGLIDNYIFEVPSTPFKEYFVTLSNHRIYIKFYLFLYLAYEQFVTLRELKESKPFRKNDRNLTYIDRLLKGERVKSKKIIEYMELENNDYDPVSLTKEDKIRLRRLKDILEMSVSEPSLKTAQAAVMIFGKKHRPINHLLSKLGFSKLQVSQV